MNQGTLTAIVAVVAVAALGLLMRRMGGHATPGTALPPSIEPDEAVEDEDDDEEETAAVTSDGWAFVPIGDRDRVQLVPPRVPDETVPQTGRQGQEQLARGDLIAARVTRGAPDHDPWRLEGLGRDHEYRAWRFETEEAARAALALVMSRVVRPARDADGEPLALGAADFADARRREEEIEAELANMPDASERQGEPPWSR
jgi:hypothetical protein